MWLHWQVKKLQLIQQFLKQKFLFILFHLKSRFWGRQLHSSPTFVLCDFQNSPFYLPFIKIYTERNLIEYLLTKTITDCTKVTRKKFPSPVCLNVLKSTFNDNLKTIFFTWIACRRFCCFFISNVCPLWIWETSLTTSGRVNIFVSALSTDWVSCSLPLPSCSVIFWVTILQFSLIKMRNRGKYVTK